VLDAYADRWALVTGASSGIGAEFARRLAELGMHLVLVARRKDQLDELAQELHTKHGAKCVVFAADLSDPSQVGDLLRFLREKKQPIELLVNNAGFAVVGEIEDANHDCIREMLRLNVVALTRLTYALLPPMLDRGHGAVINMSSVSAFQPVAYMGAYAATKAYVLHLSEALAAEVRDRGVTVLALCPGATRTAFFDVAGVPGWLKKQRAHEPRQVVNAALKALEKRRQYIVPGWKNYLRALLVRFFTRRTVVKESMKYFRPRSKLDQPEK
jgi:short-subunit dehydrogenase